MLNKKTVLIASENVWKSRKIHEKMEKTQKTRGKSLKRGKMRRKYEQKDSATFRREQILLVPARR